MSSGHYYRFMRLLRLWIVSFTLLALNNYALAAAALGANRVDGESAAQMHTGDSAPIIDTTQQMEHTDCCDPDQHGMPDKPCKSDRYGSCVCKMGICQGSLLQTSTHITTRFAVIPQLVPDAALSSAPLATHPSRLLRPPIH